jgi:hypothetical protein
VLSKDEELERAITLLIDQVNQLHILLDMLGLPPGNIEERILFYEGRITQ